MENTNTYISHIWAWATTKTQLHHGPRIDHPNSRKQAMPRHHATSCFFTLPRSPGEAGHRSKKSKVVRRSRAFAIQDHLPASVLLGQVLEVNGGQNNRVDALCPLAAARGCSFYILLLLPSPTQSSACCYGHRTYIHPHVAIAIVYIFIHVFGIVVVFILRQRSQSQCPHRLPPGYSRSLSPTQDTHRHTQARWYHWKEKTEREMRGAP